MTDARPAQRVEMISIDRITIMNPRVRNQGVFKEIVNNIAQLGLKRPITVTRRAEAGGPFYDLVCGQGRLEAYRALGQTEVPALVVGADPEDCLVASLVENCARRHHHALDLLQDIGGMRQRGYSSAEIARKTGLSLEYVNGVARLLEADEQRLLRSVESGAIPISIAVKIAEADDQDVQTALQEAYETGLLKGRKLLAAKRLVESRRRRGKGLTATSKRQGPKMSADALLRAYEEDTDRKRIMIRRTAATRNRLVFITEALRKLSSDQRFVSLVEEENLTTMPKNVTERINRSAVSQ